jgi:hypothetical protein
LYNEKNKDKKSEYNKIYQLRYSIIQKLKSNIRTLIRMSFKRVKGNLKKECKTEQILGCTINEFINHIECSQIISNLFYIHFFKFPIFYKVTYYSFSAL